MALNQSIVHSCQFNWTYRLGFTEMTSDSKTAQLLLSFIRANFKGLRLICLNGMLLVKNDGTACCVPYRRAHLNRGCALAVLGKFKVRRGKEESICGICEVNKILPDCHIQIQIIVDHFCHEM